MARTKRCERNERKRAGVAMCHEFQLDCERRDLEDALAELHPEPVTGFPWTLDFGKMEADQLVRQYGSQRAVITVEDFFIGGRL